jgi:hypothetical protein
VLPCFPLTRLPSFAIPRPPCRLTPPHPTPLSTRGGCKDRDHAACRSKTEITVSDLTLIDG